MRKPLRIAVPALMLAAAGAAAFFTLDLQAKLGLEPEDDTSLVLYGNVDIRQVELGIRVSGRIAEMPFQEGDRVHAGKLLATLDRRPYEDDFRLAAAEVAIEDSCPLGPTIKVNSRAIQGRRKDFRPACRHSPLTPSALAWPIRMESDV
jgi:multidrug efflux pump subunit AcrA (membrane-fusion protein)